MSEGERQNILKDLTDEEAQELLYDWNFWARPKQLEPPRKWYIWLVLSGRGFGKTRTGAEWIRSKVESGKHGRIALVAKDAADARDIMVEGESGIIAVSPPWFRPHYEPSKRRLTWPNGATATTYSSEEPDQLRGPQHSIAWVDELAKFKYPQDTWDNLEFSLRLGLNPQCLVSTTPRPIKVIKDLIADKQTVVTKGNSYENISNLSASYVRRIIQKYEGTRLGRQELHAEILDDNPDALWSRGLLEKQKVVKHPPLKRIVVAIDPAASANEESSETGIIAAGIGEDGFGYVLDDLSLRALPSRWARAAITGYYKFLADLIVGEVNNGGDMVEAVIRSVDSSVPYKKVHASRGKYTRAEPVSALYEQGKIFHVGNFPELEDQMCEWTPGDKSPDRLDALVWAITELMLGGEEEIKNIW